MQGQFEPTHPPTHSPAEQVHGTMAEIMAAQDAHDTAVLRRQLLVGARGMEEREGPPATVTTHHVNQDFHLPQQREVCMG